jgi:hypothetical protein
MAASYDDAVAELFQAPHAQFVAERKRLAGELKDAGDKAGATKLGKINRPPISAWAVNQLWWHARDAFESLFESAKLVRDGDLAAASGHREAIAKLRARAASMLSDAGHGATESTLRKVSQTLSALAANDGWDPDPPGALSDDRDPPGFEALGIAPLAAVAPAPAPKHEPKQHPPKKSDDDEDDKAALERARKQAEAREQAEAAAERRKAEEARAKQLAERHRIEAAIRTGKGEVEARVRELERLKKSVETAEANVEQARAVVADLEERLEQLGD